MIEVVVWVIGLYILALITWLFYVAIMHLVRVKDSLHPFAKFNAYILLLIGLPLDVLTNVTLGSLFFLEPPREFLLTDRLKRHKSGRGWKKGLATWVCTHLLEQFDYGHCR